MGSNIENINYGETLTNIETYIAVYKYALKKAQSPLLKTFLMGIASGLFLLVLLILVLFLVVED